MLLVLARSWISDRYGLETDMATDLVITFVNRYAPLFILPPLMATIAGAAVLLPWGAAALFVKVVACVLILLIACVMLLTALGKIDDGRS